MIFEKNKINNKSRLLAGYCWKWEKEGRENTDIHDIEIDGLSMSWNLGNTDTWAIDEDSVNEIGCIHTSQGLEFDYVGVIIGEDMRFENGKIMTDFNKRASTDQSLRGIKKMYKENPDKAQKTADDIKNNAQDEADNIIKNARSKMQESVDELTKESETRKREFAETKKQFDIYRAKMEALLISQLELLKDMKED